MSSVTWLVTAKKRFQAGSDIEGLSERLLRSFNQQTGMASSHVFSKGVLYRSVTSRLLYLSANAKGST